MDENSQSYIIYTIPETSLDSIESRNLRNDFPINDPVDFGKDHRLDKLSLDSYIESIKMLGLEDPSDKISEEKLKSVKLRTRGNNVDYSASVHSKGICR